MIGPKLFDLVIIHFEYDHGRRQAGSQSTQSISYRMTHTSSPTLVVVVVDNSNQHKNLYDVAITRYTAT